MILYKSYNLCVGEVVSQNIAANGGVVSNFQNLPAFVITYNSFGGGKGYVISAGSVGTYQFTFDITPAGGGATETYYVDILIANCIESTFENCCDDQCNIVWLNREGGFQNYIFTGIKTFEVESGDAETYKDFGRVIKYSEKKDVYSGMICTTGNIPRTHVDYIDSLKISIQAWLIRDGGYTPILLDVGSFVKYTSREKLFDVRVRFIMAQEIVIQSQ
jgi:hypothetical protein